jgi:hypothetical protein
MKNKGFAAFGSLLVLGILVFGFVLTSCDNGTTNPGKNRTVTISGPNDPPKVGDTITVTATGYDEDPSWFGWDLSGDDKETWDQVASGSTYTIPDTLSGTGASTVGCYIRAYYGTMTYTVDSNILGPIAAGP